MILVKNMTKLYKNGENEVAALKDVDLHVKKGEFIAIMGPSGSGKSTLMNIIGCLDKPTTGEYYLDGKSISQLDKRQLAYIRNKRIGFVFQNFNLLPRMSSLRNVEIPMIYAGVSPKERRKKAMEALESVGLGDRWHHKPNELSGGQKQRVAIARALVRKPQLLLLDEPTTYLDVAARDNLPELLSTIRRELGLSVLVISHDAKSLGKVIDRAVVLQDGTLYSAQV